MSKELCNWTGRGAEMHGSEERGDQTAGEKKAVCVGVPADLLTAVIYILVRDGDVSPGRLEEILEDVGHHEILLTNRWIADYAADAARRLVMDIAEERPVGQQCCFLGCGAPAVWRIDPHNDDLETFACDWHLHSLLAPSATVTIYEPGP